MAFVIADRVRETTTTAGTGAVTLAGAYISFQSFSAAIGDGNQTYYTIASAATGEWEVGIGTYTTSGNTLTRNTVLASSNGGSAVNFSVGTKDVFVTQPSKRSLLINSAGSGLFAGSAAFASGDTLYADTTTNLTKLSIGAANTVMTSSGTAPQWSTSLNLAGSLTLSAGTANGVLYLNGSKVATSGGALVFDGTNLGIGTSSPAAKLDVNGDASIYGVTVGRGAGAVSTNTAVGASALAANSTGAYSTAIGYQASYYQTGNNNTVLGYAALYGASGGSSTGVNNTAVGYAALNVNSSGSYNVGLGAYTLQANTTASNNTAVGYQAGYSNTTGSINTFIGVQSGYNFNTSGNTGNTCLGTASGYSLTTGTNNTFIGSWNSTGSGHYVTTGSKNTILGAYNGNQGGLDIRTASNYIVLSDGDGNPRVISDSSGYVGIGVNPNSGTRLFVVGADGNAGNEYSGGVMVAGSSDTTKRINLTYDASNDCGILVSVDTGTSWKATRIPYGTVIIGTQAAVSGGGKLQLDSGITFPATQSALSDANTLDDYEEGTWTPSVEGSSTAGTTTYGAIRTGTYVKIGKQVTVSFRVDYSAATGTGYLTITGCPFSAGGSNDFIGTVMTDNLNWGSTASYNLYMSNGSGITLWKSADNTTWTIVNVTNESAGIIGEITFFVA